MFPIPANPMSSSYPILFTLVFPKPKYDWKRLNGGLGIDFKFGTGTENKQEKKKCYAMVAVEKENESQEGIQLTTGKTVLNM